MPEGTLRSFYQRHAALVWTVAVLAPVVVLGVGLAVEPHTFWDRFLWEDILGPTYVDAQGWNGACWGDEGPYRATRPAQGTLGCEPGDVLAVDGYTPTSEVTYGVVLAAILYGVWNGLIRRNRIETDGWFVLALLPYIVFGPTVRSLEDARVFMTPQGDAGLFSYIFISPWIYMQIGVYAILALALGVFLRNRRASTSANERLLLVGSVLALVAATHSFVVHAFRSQFLVTPHPAWSWAGALLGFALYAWLDRRNARTTTSVVAVIGLPILFPTFGLFARWAVDPWTINAPGYHYKAAGFILLFAFAATFLVWLVARLNVRFIPWAIAFTMGINLALVFGHMLDAFATFLTLCAQPVDPVCTGASFLELGLGGYGEKHPLSAKLLEVANGWGFPIAKLLMVLLVVYLLEKEVKEGAESDRQLVGLIKMAIFVLGFAPGLRDFLLVTFDLGTV